MRNSKGRAAVLYTAVSVRAQGQGLDVCCMSAHLTHTQKRECIFGVEVWACRSAVPCEIPRLAGRLNPKVTIITRRGEARRTLAYIQLCLAGSTLEGT